MSPGWRSALRREVAAARRLVVLGVGAPENGDDAAGVFCAEEIRRGLQGRRPRRIKVIVGADAPEGATGLIRRFRPSLVLIVDAALSKKRPGSVFFVARKDLAEEAMTTHAIPLGLLSAYIEDTIGCRVLLLGIQPKAVARGAPLSAPVRSAARAVAKEILAGLRASPAGPPLRSSSASGHRDISSPPRNRAGGGRRCCRP
jgi:hydrogenase 3 maturation protease